MATDQYEMNKQVSTTFEQRRENCITSNRDLNDLDTLDHMVKQGFTPNDQTDMRRMGKKQEFRRNFRLLTTVGFTCCVMGTWEILMTSNSQALLAGGSAGLFWSLCWSYLGQTFIVLSLAEMSAMAPTAGGQYHWISEFAPPQWQKLLSYLSGWLSTISWQSIVALDCWLVGIIIQSLIVIEYENSYSPARWQATLLIFASVSGIGLFNVFGAKHLPLAEGIFVTGHFFAFFPIIITILVLGPKRDAHSVFFSFTDNGAGWPNVGWATLVGQVSAMFSVLGSDSVAHMAEEVEDAGVVVPRAMVWSFIINIPFTFAMVISYLFCMPSVEDAVSDPTGFPFIYVFRQATGTSGGTLGMTVVILFLITMITISAMASTSRQTFAFARDNGLPFASRLGRVHEKCTAAFNAMLSLSTVALMGTYVISIACVTTRRLSPHAIPLPQSRWTLGRWGLSINICALIYAFWSFFWSFWPNAHDITAENFNWACVLFVGLMSTGVILYFVHARKVYNGPVTLVEGRNESSI